MNNSDRIEYNNEEEAEVAQINSMVSAMNAVDAVRSQLELQSRRPSLSECDQCGEDIPPLRQAAIPGVQLCVHCQGRAERFKSTHRLPGSSSD